jgi:hypothetical protein
MPGKPDSQSLRELYRSKAKAIVHETLQADGQVPVGAFEALGSLSQLADLYDAAQPRPLPKRWPVAIALVVTLLIASALLLPVPQTGIELDLKLSEVSFLLPEQQVLSDAISVSNLGVSGLRGVRLPPEYGLEAAPKPASGDADAAIRLSVDSSAERPGTIDVAALALPANTRVRVRRTRTPNQYRISLTAPEGAALDLRADVNGRVQVALAGTPARDRDFGSPKPVLLDPGSNEVDLDVTFPTVPVAPFVPHLRVEELLLSRVEQLVEPNRTFVRRASTILSGTLYLSALDSPKRELREGERIQFDRSAGEIHRLELREDGIFFGFSGDVRGMRSGSDQTPRNLMPSWLESLAANHSISLVWGSALYLYGIIIGVLQWWRVPI